MLLGGCPLTLEMMLAPMIGCRDGECCNAHCPARMGFDGSEEAAMDGFSLPDLLRGNDADGCPVRLLLIVVAVAFGRIGDRGRGRCSHCCCRCPWRWVPISRFGLGSCCWGSSMEIGCRILKLLLLELLGTKRCRH
ncbi:hypothetical protein ACLOJK_011890 [Asimina triloba]